MPRLCALLLLAGVAVAALLRRRPHAILAPGRFATGFLASLSADDIALLRMPCSGTRH